MVRYKFRVIVPEGNTCNDAQEMIKVVAHAQQLNSNIEFESIDGIPVKDAAGAYQLTFKTDETTKVIRVLESHGLEVRFICATDDEGNEVYPQRRRRRSTLRNPIHRNGEHTEVSDRR